MYDELNFLCIFVSSNYLLRMSKIKYFMFFLGFIALFSCKQQEQKSVQMSEIVDAAQQIRTQHAENLVQTSEMRFRGCKSRE